MLRIARRLLAVSPLAFAPALQDWSLDAPVHAFCRDAFGAVYVYSMGTVVVLYSSGDFLVHPCGVTGFLNHMLGSTELQKSDVIGCRRDLGSLAWDECYTVIPPLPIETRQPRRYGKDKVIPYVSTIGTMVAHLSAVRKHANQELCLDWRKLARRKPPMWPGSLWLWPLEDLESENQRLKTYWTLQ